jgi:cyclophilin family peptidyl-prolyl cis-trans isomerase
MKKSFLLLLWLCSVVAIAQKKSRKDYLVTLTTDFGTMHLVLFDETPLHKANFVKLVESKFYDSLLFHRVIDGFMIQGGDPNSKRAKANEKLGNGGGDLTRIPFEFVATHVHRRGALAAARDGNPQKASSACQFYIVQGKKLTDDELKTLAKANKMTYTDAQMADYKTIGGTPRLDNSYTVFGEVIDNYDTIDKIATQARDATTNRPNTDIRMTLTIKLLRKRKITRKFGYKFTA